MLDTVLPPKSPPHLLIDSDTTNPNTPKTSVHKADTGAPDDATSIKPSPGFSTSSDEPPRYNDILPTWPKAIDVTKSTAMATWQNASLPGISLDIHWHVASNKAFFRLRVDTLISHGSGLPSRKGKTGIYVFIYPERIRQLSVDAEPVDKKLGANTISLHFDLTKPPVLILPKPPCKPKNETAKALMEAFRGLASQSSFTIYANIPRRKLPATHLNRLCDAVSAGGMISLAAHVNTASLYEGQGAQVLEGESLAPPPAYPGPSSPGPPNERQAKKRRRRSSSSESTEGTNHKAFEVLSNTGLSLLKTYFDDQLAAHKKEIVEMQEAHKKEIAEMLDRTESRILETVRKEMDEQHGSIQEGIDRMIQQEMVELEETVMKNISEAPLQATLTFPANPWY